MTLALYVHKLSVCRSLGKAEGMSVQIQDVTWTTAPICSTSAPVIRSYLYRQLEAAGRLEPPGVALWGGL